jgi:uridine kinase
MILAITGPTASGKTTVSRLLAKKIGRCVNIDADDIKHLIATGFIYNDTPSGIAQWQLLGKNIGMLTKNFTDEGYSVIINGYINEPAWDEITSMVRINWKFLLIPDLGTKRSWT